VRARIRLARAEPTRRGEQYEELPFVWSGQLLVLSQVKRY